VSSDYVAARVDRLEVFCRGDRFGTQPAEVSRYVEAMMTVVARFKPRHRNVLGYVAGVWKVPLCGETGPSSIRTLDSQSTRSCVPPWRSTKQGGTVMVWDLVSSGSFRVELAASLHGGVHIKGGMSVTTSTSPKDSVFFPWTDNSEQVQRWTERPQSGG
jgi:hypothetical protein